MIGFFFRLSKTDVMPCIASSRALGSQEFTVDPYSGFDELGVWFKENRHGDMGA